MDEIKGREIDVACVVGFLRGIYFCFGHLKTLIVMSCMESVKH